MGPALERFLGNRWLVKSWSYIGKFETNKKFGNEKQFRFTKAEAIVNIDPRSALHYACTLTKGMGPSKEDAIWDAFGKDWKDADLNKIKGLSLIAKESWTEALAFIEERKGLAKSISGLLSMGMTDNMASAAIEAFGESAYRVISGDPYKITDLPNYGFSNADAIALKEQMPLGDPRRVRAAIIYSMSQQLGGSSCLSLDSLINFSLNLLGGAVSHVVIRECISSLITDGELVDVRDWIATKQDHKDEMTILNFFEQGA